MQRYAAWTVGGIALTGILMGTALKAIADTPSATNYADPINYPGSWPAIWTPYTVNGVGILDATNGGGDGTKGAAPSQSGDVAPCTGGSVFFSRDTNNLYFRLCVNADPYVSTASSGPYTASGSWALLIDVNGDGFREFAVFLDGKQGQSFDSTPDNLYVVYKSNLNQGFDSTDLQLGSGSSATPGSAILWVQDSAIGSPIRQTTVEGETGWPTLGRDLSRTRSVDRGDGTFYLDIQVPLSALDATAKGGPKVMFSTPVSFVFSTANSNSDPYQKDIAFPGTFTPTATVPLPFGDIVTGNTTYPQPAIPTVTAGTCSATNLLSATVIDSLSITGPSTVGTSLTSVKFFYQFDSDGDGKPDPSGTWTLIGNGALPTTTPATTNPWSVTWNSTLLASGQYFIKAVAVDGSGYTTDSVDAIDDAGANTAAGGDTFNPATLQSAPIVPIFASFSNTCGAKPPTIDLDGDDTSGASGNDFKTTFTLAGSAVSIVDANTPTTETLDTFITDADSPQLSRTVVDLTNVQTGDSLSISGLLPAGISLDPSSTATRIVLTGSVALASYEAALEQIRFSSTSANLSDRTITFQITDTTGLVSNVATTTISIAVSTDYSDAPISGTAPNGTGTNNYGNATHNIVGSLKLGANIDSETASIANANASGDGTDDDGITLPNLTAGTNNYSIPVANITVTGTGTLHAWIDFNKNGTFDPGEYTSVAVNSNTPAGALSWSGITIGAVGNTFARFRLTTDATVTSATPSGNGSNGEVEDYQVLIVKQTINNTPSATSCSVLGGTLSGNNLFAPLDNGTFGVENGTPNQSPATNPYPGIVSGGNYKQFYSITHGDYSYVANPVTPRNSFQHPGITDPVYGATGRFFASDPNTSTPTLTTTLTGLQPNQFYEYSFWAANSEPNGASNNVDVMFNGQKIYSTGPLPAITTALEWKKHTISFTNGPSTSITIDLKSTQTGSGGNDFYLDNIELRDCNFTVDSGDAPPSYGDAIHTTIPATPNVYLGTVAPDGETSTPLGGDNGAGADGDDNQGSDDEDAFTALNSVPITGTYALNNIPVKNTSGENVTLHAWIDFNRDGKFAAGEYQSTTVANNASTANLSWTVPNTTSAGNTYARFRITPNALAVDNVSTTDIDERSKDAVINGEVEDYQVAISAAVASNPNVLLVKRITAVNGTFTNNGINLDVYDPDPTYPYDKNVIQSGLTPPTTDKWPNTSGNPLSSTFLLGARDGGVIKPGDEVEYTIYFLSAGTGPAKAVQLCDRVPGNQTFVPNAYNFITPGPGVAPSVNADRGIALSYNGSFESYTNLADADIAQYYPPGQVPLPSFCNTVANPDPNSNPTGAVVINLGAGATGTTGGELPNANNPGSPNTSYGFVRFKVKNIFP